MGPGPEHQPAGAVYPRPVNTGLYERKRPGRYCQCRVSCGSYLQCTWGCSLYHCQACAGWTFPSSGTGICSSWHPRERLLPRRNPDIHGRGNNASRGTRQSGRSHPKGEMGGPYGTSPCHRFSGVRCIGKYCRCLHRFQRGCLDGVIEPHR